MAEKMSAAVSEVPGITTGFQFPVQMRFNELMTGARQDVVCKIFGENLDTLAHYANELGKLASSVEGAKDIYVETVTGLPQIVIEYNRNMVAQYGLDITAINNIINTAFGGQRAGLVFEGERRFDMVVRLAGDQRKNIEDVQNLLIPAANGTQVPLNQLATVQIKDGPNQIQREDAKRRIVVGFNVRGRDVQTIVTDLQQKASYIKLPAGYYITYGGAFENLEAAKKRLSIVVPLALGLILLILYFAFNSIKHSLIIYSAIPLSAIGGAFALAIRGMPFSISAGVGFIALFGVAVLNGIVLIAEFRKLKKEGMTDLKTTVVQGTKTRLRPVLMTACVASLGFLPMALSHGSGAEVQRPLATVVIGGLLTATFLTLFLLPVLYVLFEKTSFKMKTKTIALLLLCLLPIFCNAQQTISLPAAIDSALQNNLKLKSQRLTAAYHKRMQGTAWDINKTTLTIELGNVNSAYNDTRYGITQNMAFPLVYAKQRSLLEGEWKAAEFLVAIKEKETIKQVSGLYNEINCLLQKRRLLLSADSLYAEFERRAVLRHQLGESNLLEKNSAENLRGEIMLQLQELEADLEVLNIRFAYILNTEKSYIPNDEILKLDNPYISEITGHPYLSYLSQQQKNAKTEYQLEKNKLLPELVGGYYNQSYSGWQKVNDVDRFYTRSNRFSSVQFGIGVPVIFFSQNARIKALSLNKHISEIQTQDGNNMLQVQYAHALTFYKQQLKAVDYYENTALNNASGIVNTATKQFTQGDINYLEYTILINQAIAVRNNYYDAIKKLNESIAEINYLTNN